MYILCVLQVGKGNMKHPVILPVRMHARSMIAVTSVSSYTSKCCKISQKKFPVMYKYDGQNVKKTKISLP